MRNHKIALPAVGSHPKLKPTPGQAGLREDKAVGAPDLAVLECRGTMDRDTRIAQVILDFMTCMTGPWFFQLRIMSWHHADELTRDSLREVGSIVMFVMLRYIVPSEFSVGQLVTLFDFYASVIPFSDLEHLDVKV